MRHVFVTFALLPLIAVTACASSSGGDTKNKTKSTDESKQYSNDPMYSLTLMRQGSILMEQGLLEPALERFVEADKVAPGNATVHNMIGLCYLRMGKYDQALSSFNHALQLIPDFVDVRNNRGATYLALKQYHLAEVDFIAVLSDSHYPHRRQVYYNLGLTYFERNQLGAAEENFRKAIALPSPVFSAYLRLAELAQKQGETERAKSLLEEARFTFPDQIEVALRLGELLMTMGEENEARPYLEQVIDSNPTSAAADRARSLLGSE